MRKIILILFVVLFFNFVKATENFEYYDFADFGEFGRIDVNSSWKEFQFKNTYTSPIVIAKPLSYNDETPAHIRIKDVNSRGFKIKIENWLSGEHEEEEVSYLVIEEGNHSFDNMLVLAGKDYISGYLPKKFNFQQNFSFVPLVFAQLQTSNDIEPADALIKNITKYFFMAKVIEKESSDGNHSQETLGYIAISSGPRKYHKYLNITYEFLILRNFDSGWKDINFLQNFDNPIFIADTRTAKGEDPFSLRYKSLDGKEVKLKLQEEQSEDLEMKHSREDISYLALEYTKKENCIDTDKGDNKYEKGELYYYDKKIAEDSCINISGKEYALENFCLRNRSVVSLKNLRYCENGCVNGSCVKISKPIKMSEKIENKNTNLEKSRNYTKITEKLGRRKIGLIKRLWCKVKSIFLGNYQTCINS